jgi:ABC-type sugar transport system substrate-binding protein
VKRRDFITLLGGAAATWPLAARAQQAERIRTVGILLGSTDNTEMLRLLDGFMESFKKLGWTEDRNVRFDIRWSGGNPQNNAIEAQDLVRQQPDVIFAAPSKRRRTVHLSCSRMCRTQSHRGLSTTWRAQPAISLVSATSNSR